MFQRSMRFSVLSLVAAALVFAPSSFAAEKAKSKAKAKPKAQPKTDEAPNILDLPWNLRDAYKFDFKNSTLIYGADNGQWSLDVAGVGMVFDKVRTKVVLGDGKAIDVSAFGPGGTTRDKVTSLFGEGVDYSVMLPEKEGLRVRHSLTINNASPFHAFHIQVTNVTQAPIEIAKIVVMDIPPGSLAGFSADTEVHMRRLNSFGLSPGYDPQAVPMFMMLQDKPKGFICAIGVVPSGKGASGVNLQAHGGTWQGEVSTVFDPPVRVDPGQTIEADPVWIVLNIPQPAELDRQLAFAYANLRKPAATAEVPPAWVTTGEGESIEDLRRAVSAWGESGIQHVLVPSGWEGVPGSLEGGSPRFPK
ncbi:MAG: hypothetical protein WC655_20340, partial [Candidatus Hydrogenedentales bacterium]